MNAEVVDPVPGQVRPVDGRLVTFVLIAAVCMLIHSAIAWALSEAHRNYQGSHRGKVGVIVSVLAAAVAGTGLGWLNFLIGVGRCSVERSKLAGVARHIVVC